jgi:hypothetical protein
MYLTKSRFKMALECPTKLYYSMKGGDEYYDKNIDSEFLQGLADGGQQVGELAKFKYHDDPLGQKITVETLDHDAAVIETEIMLNRPGRVVIAEAALRKDLFFIRVDILIRDELTKSVELIEVKSKRVTTEDVEKKFKKTSGGYAPQWLPYLYDIAFQTMVAQLALPGHIIQPKLLLIDSEKKCDIDGLHQYFPVSVEVDGKGLKRTVVKPLQGLTKDQLGSLDSLREVDMADIVNDLLALPIDNPAHIPWDKSANIKVFSSWASTLIGLRERTFLGISKACRACQFRAPEGSALKSGVHECWKDALARGLIDGDSSDMSLSTPLSIDIWGGGAGQRSFATDVLEKGRAFLRDIQAEDIASDKKDEPEKMTAFERRMAQINVLNADEISPYLNQKRLDEMDSWEWPLHMIDFETSAPALPFFKGMRPYETLAFEFSHHIMDRDGGGKIQVRHANQWISTEAAKFPNIDFVRALKRALMPSGELHGTVFRYHNHENTVLRNIRKILVDDNKPARSSDSKELVDFIDLITKSSSKERPFHEGRKAMVDLHRLVQEGYYSKHAGGSISLKSMLPAILQDAGSVAKIFSRKGIYGKAKAIKSLNFDDHIWLQEKFDNNPYKTLPPIFDAERADLNEMLSRLVCDDGEDESSVTDGGLAMTVYNYTQFNSLSEFERQSIEDALLRYCELDTLAMVILVLGLFELRGWNPILVHSS